MTWARRTALFRRLTGLGLLSLSCLLPLAQSQQLDPDLFPRRLSLPGPRVQEPVPAGLPAARVLELPDAGQPISVTISKTMYLPPEMYGQWSIRATLVKTDNLDNFPAVINDIWILERMGDQVVVTNPNTGGSAAIRVDRVENNTATFHTSGVRDNRLFFEQTPTVTVAGDLLNGQSINKIGTIRDGRVIRMSTALYRLDAERISGARTQFRPESMDGPDIHIEDVKIAR